MTTLSAFNHQNDIRDAALYRLKTQIDLHHVKDCFLQWDGIKGSSSGCLIESDEATQWQKQLGLATWLAYAIDATATPTKLKNAHEMASEILTAIPMGIDSTELGYQAVLTFLNTIDLTDIEATPLLNALHAVSLAQQDYASMNKADWRALRKNILQATATLAEQPVEIIIGDLKLARQHAIAGMLEAAAWDVVQSPSTIAEVIRHWLHLQNVNANNDIGWTQSNHDYVDGILNQMYEQYIRPNPEETHDVFYFMEQHHPKVANDLKHYYKQLSEYIHACTERACILLKQVFIH